MYVCNDYVCVLHCLHIHVVSFAMHACANVCVCVCGMYVLYMYVFIHKGGHTADPNGWGSGQVLKKYIAQLMNTNISLIRTTKKHLTTS